MRLERGADFLERKTSWVNRRASFLAKIAYPSLCRSQLPRFAAVGCVMSGWVKFQ